MASAADRDRALQWARELIAAYEREPLPRPSTVVNVEVARALLAAEQEIVALRGTAEHRHELLSRAMAPIGGHARGFAQALLAEIGAEVGSDPYEWSSHPETLRRRIELLPKRTQKQLAAFAPSASG